MSILASFPRCLVFTAWFCVFLLSGAVWSAELGQAKVSAILRDVQKTEGSKTEPAAVGDVIAGGGRITTQGQSLAELKFPDGSVIRIGNNSTFSFDPNDRTVRLDRGTALVSTPPKAEGINIVSGGVSGTVGGDPAGKTFLVTAYPAESGGAKGAPTGGFGLMVLQGSSATTVSAPSGSVSIAPGQFALVGGKMDGAPKVLTVDVGQVFRSSPLVNSFPEPLPTKGAILSTAIQQQGSQSSGGLRSTGTTGVALTSGGDLLTGGSKPAKSGGYTFEVASNVPGTGRQEKQATATEKTRDELDIATAAGGPIVGGPLPVTGSTGGGGGGGRTFFVGVTPPSFTGQQAIAAILNNPNNLPATVVNAQVQSKTYDGLVSAIIQNALLSGIQSGDNVSLQNDTTGIFASKNVGTWSVATAMGLIGPDAANYSLTPPNMNGTITAKVLTISAMTPSTVATKVYNGTLDAAVTVGALDGLVGSEVLGGTTVVGTFADKNIGAKNVAAVYTLVDGANGELASNYSLAAETLTGTITAKDLSVFSAAVTTKVYDGNDAAVVTGAVLVGNSTTDIDGKFIGTETVTLNGGTAGTFASKNVGAGQGVTTTMTLGGSDAGNYTLNTQPTLSGTITAKALTMTGSTTASKVYDGNTTASVTLGTLSGEVAGEILGSSTVVGTFNSKDVVGANTVTAVYTLTDGLNGELASNYSLANDSLASTITAKSLTMTGSTAATKVYDGNRTASVTLGALSGEVAGETLGTSTVVGTFNSKDVLAANTVTAVYTLVDGANGELASNYSLVNDSLASTITAKSLTMTGSTAASKVYDGNRTASVTLGALSGEVVGETLGTSTVVGAFNSKDVLGANTVTAVYTLVDGANGELASNYSLANDGLASTITAKSLTMTGSTAATKVYDGNRSASVTLGTLSGEIVGETLGTSTVVGTFNSKDVLGANTVTAAYTLVDGASGELASNYSLANDSLASTITAKSLTMTGSAATSKVYDGNRTASVTLGTLSGEVVGETLGTSTVVGTFNSKDVLAANTVTAVYTLVDGASGELASNYSLANDNLGSTITAKGLSITAPSIGSKAYDGLATAGSLTLGTLSGFVGSETVTASGAAADYSSANVGSYNSAVTYNLADGLNGGLASNYSLAAGSATGVITAKALTISVATPSTVASKVYNGTRDAAVTVGALDGEVAGETLGATTVVGTFTDKNIGTKNVAAVYTLVDGANGELASNYSLAAETLTGTITAKDLSVFSAAVTTKAYDGNDTAVVTGAVLVGNSTTDIDGKFIGTETVTLNGGTVGTFASKNVGAGQGVTTTMTLGGSDAGNYTLNTQPTLNGTITAKALTMTGSSAVSKVYDGNRSASVTLGTLSGEVAGETLGTSIVVGTFNSKDVLGANTVTAVYMLVNGLNGELASNYSLANDSLASTITAKSLSISGPSIGSKIYDGLATAGSLTLGTVSGFVGSETVTASGAAADYSSANVGTYSGVVVSYTLSNGSNGGLASNYSLAAGSVTGLITAKDVTIASGSVSGKVYDGNTGAVVTAGSLSGLVLGESLGTTTAVGTFASKDVGTRNVASSYTLTDGANLASNYNLLNPTETLSAAITAKGLSVTAPSIASKKYDGTTATGVVTVGTLSGFVGTETVTAAGSAANYSSANVGSYSSAVTYTLSDGSNGGLASNYSLAAGSATGAISAKDLVVNAAGITVGKVYDGGTSINPATQVAIGLGALTGNSTGANDGNYIGTEAVSLAVDAAGTFERNLPGTMIPISTTVKLASGNAVNNNYSLRAQPTGLTGEITGTANLNQNGVGISVSSADYIHIRNTTASRMQDGLTISSATGSVLLENSSFDGWMQRSTPNQTISDGGATTFTFSESAATAVNSPVLRLKMEANDPANVDMNKQYMLLGDYQVLLRRDPNGAPGSGDEVATTLFSFPGSADDPNGFGSMAPSADLVIRDSATTQVKDLPWDTKEYSSLDGSGVAVDSGNYAAVSGEFKGDNAASGLDIATSSGGAAGKWDVMVSDPSLGGEGKVTDVRLKYSNNTKALIQGPNGVRLVNVIFEGMDEVEVGAGLNDKVLMSGTLVSDPNIGKMVVKAGQTLEAYFASDATMKDVRTSAGNAEILAGVVKDVSSPTGYSFISGPNRVLEMQSATIAGQLSLASHTIVFNNANITSGGVIDARTRDGMVNRSYGSVVPGTVSFMGANGNTFLNTANSASMSIANSGNIVSALSGGQMSENGAGGATVMNVGRVR
jgi:trimeric autotransporter adhesin